VPDAEGHIEGEPPHRPPPDREDALGALVLVRGEGVRADVVVADPEELALGIEREPALEEREEAIIVEVRGPDRQHE
jgi:hypothetical protein